MSFIGESGVAGGRAEKLIHLCDERGMKYKTNMTTNGLGLKPNILEDVVVG